MCMHARMRYGLRTYVDVDHAGARQNMRVRIPTLRGLYTKPQFTLKLTLGLKPPFRLYGDCAAHLVRQYRVILLGWELVSYITVLCV